jgi:hypothetical protein
MVRSYLSFIAIALLLGCTTKQETDFIQSNSDEERYHKQLQKTEKIQLYQDNVTKILLTATYIYTSKLENHDTRDEVFIVGFSMQDQTSRTLDSEGNSLTLNGKKPKEIKVLNLNDEQLKHLSFVTPWSSYYLVTFPHQSTKKLMLLFESKQYGKGTLYFAKVAKYVLSKEAF